MPTHVEFSVRTGRRTQFSDVTARVREAIAASGVAAGLCVVFVPHTTAALTINENADPDVLADLERGLARLSPDDPAYRHAEGNSDAHLKTLMTGPSLTLIIAGGKPVLGTWQGIYLCEYDGPRTRTVHVKCVAG